MKLDWTGPVFLDKQITRIIALRFKSRSLIVRFVAGIYGMILFLVGLCPKQKFKAIVQMGKINAWLNNNQAFVFMRRMSDI